MRRAAAAQKQALDGGAGVGALLRVTRLQLLVGAVQHFLGQALREGFEHTVDVFAARQHSSGTGDFRDAPALGLAVKLLDQRHMDTLIDPAHKALHTCVHDGFGLGHSGLAAGLRGLYHASQIVHGVQVHVAQL